MKRKNKKPPHRLREREGKRKLTGGTLVPLASEGKRFDAVESKLSLALDALLDAIQTYRELPR